VRITNCKAGTLPAKPGGIISRPTDILAMSRPGVYRRWCWWRSGISDPGIAQKPFALFPLAKLGAGRQRTSSTTRLPPVLRWQRM